MENTKSAFLKLGVSDLAKGLSVAVIAVVLGSLSEGMTAHGFDFASYDWSSILDLAWKTAGVYLTKNLLTTQDSKILGVVKV